VDELWGEQAPPKVTASLQVHVANLRRILEPDRAPRSRPTRLVTRPPGYALRTDGIEVDAERFVAEAAAGSAALGSDDVLAERMLSGALARWHGDAYAGLIGSGDLLTQEAARLEELRRTTVEDLWQARIDTGAHAAAIGELEGVVRSNPLRERAWALLALAYYRAMRQGEALEALRRARTYLAEELGVDPSAQLRELEAGILAQDPALAAPRPSRATPPGAAPVPTGGAASDARVPQDDAAPRTTIGRDVVLAEVDRVLDRAAAGGGGLVVVTGEPGIGKSTFAEAAVESARARGMAVGWGGWDEESGEAALRAWATVVAGITSGLDLAGLLGEASVDLAPLLVRARAPRAGAPGSGAPSSGEPGEDVDVNSANLRLASALAGLLAEVGRSRPQLLVLDDLQWADADSLRLLRRLAPLVSDLATVVLVTCRDVAADLTADVVETLAVLARHEPVRVALAGLSPADVADLTRRRLGGEVSPELAAAVAGRTDGNPFYITEVLRLLASGGSDVTAAEVDDLDVPDGVRDVVRRRLAGLSDAAREVLAVAAVAGRRFAVDVVELVAPYDQDGTDEAFDLALLHDLVTADERPGMLRFSHALVWEAVYAQIPPHRRARLHARVADSLEQLRIGSVEAHLSELAHHYELAGPARARDCWMFASRAAGAASANGGYDEAVRLLEVALAAVEQDPIAGSADRISLLWALGRALLIGARMSAAADRLAEGARLALTSGDPVLAARIYLTVSERMAWHWRDYLDYDNDAIGLWEAILARLPEDAPGLRAQTMVSLAMELYFAPGQVKRSIALGLDAVALARTQQPEDLLRVLEIAHVVFDRPDFHDERVAIAEEQLALAEGLGRPLAVAQALCHRASDRYEGGRLDEAAADIDRALEIARRLRDVNVLLIAGWARCLFLPCRGDFTGAEEAIDRLDRLQQSVSTSGAGVAEVQRAALLQWRGHLGVLAPVLEVAAARMPTYRDYNATAVLAAEGVDAARRAAGPWEATYEIGFDYLWVSLTTIRARLWAALGDRDAIADLRAALAPYATTWAVGGASVYFDGVVAEALGVLARAAGDHEEAVDRLEWSLQEYEERGLLPFVARASAELARALSERGLPGDAAAAAVAAERAERLVAQLGIVV
jgi:DNA-binding SARP family transcriptional activator